MFDGWLIQIDSVCLTSNRKCRPSCQNEPETDYPQYQPPWPHTPDTGSSGPPLLTSFPPENRWMSRWSVEHRPMMMVIYQDYINPQSTWITWKHLHCFGFWTDSLVPLEHLDSPDSSPSWTHSAYNLTTHNERSITSCVKNLERKSFLNIFLLIIHILYHNE